MKTYEEIKEELELRIESARIYAEDRYRVAPESYGCGHDAGEVYALVSLRMWLLGED